MDDRKFEQTVKRVFSNDCSTGTDGFRDALLKRCLSVLDLEDKGREPAPHIIEEDFGTPMDDEELDMLAAAGNWQDALLNGKISID